MVIERHNLARFLSVGMSQSTELEPKNTQATRNLLEGNKEPQNASCKTLQTKYASEDAITSTS